VNLFARVVAACAFFLLIAGAMVTSTHSGLSVPDWPLSFGQFFPKMVGGVFFEHGHRMIAGTVATLTFILAFMIRARETRPVVRKLAFAACAAILAQAVLGGLTVLLRLPPAVSIAHACLAQAVFCILLALAQMTSDWWLSAEPKAGPSGRAGAYAAGAVYLQLFWGALLRHTGQGASLHVLWAPVASLAVLYALLKSWPERELRAPAALLAVLLPCQLLLGYFSYRIRVTGTLDLDLHRAAAITAAHLALGAAILGSCLILALRQRRLA
jgi:heme a synthase